METIPGTTNQGTPFHGEPFVFPCFGNVGPPYIATLSLPGFTIGLPVWLFSTPVIPNSLGASNASPPPQEHQPHVDPFPSSPIVSSSLSSSSPGESLDASNQEDKKKKKRKIKKKKDKKGRNQPTIVHHVGSVDDVGKPTNTGRKPKFPCRICKGDHLLRDFPGLPKVLEVWSMGSQQPMSPASGHHVDDNPSTSDHMVRGKKGKVNIPCWLCKEMHHTYLFPRMDEASKLLEDIVVSQQQPPTASHESPPDPPLVDEVVDLIPSSVDPTLPLESEVDTTQVLLVTIDSSGQGGISPISRNPLQVLKSFPLIGID
jgi:hypothetical protein